jgi:hypothetical protein
MKGSISPMCPTIEIASAAMAARRHLVDIDDGRVAAMDVANLPLTCSARSQAAVGAVEKSGRGEMFLEGDRAAWVACPPQIWLTKLLRVWQLCDTLSHNLVIPVSSSFKPRINAGYCMKQAVIIVSN